MNDIDDPAVRPGGPDHPGPAAPTAGGGGPLPSWPTAAYQAVVPGPGAEKLARSAVAPLVAAARGYRQVELTDVPTVARLLRLGPANSRKHRSMVEIVEQGGGAMLMPRYRPEAAYRYQPGAGRPPFVDIAEFKPVFALPDPTDPERTLKYKSLVGDTPVLDLHPATPAEWVENTPVAVITEGVIKGDAGLTAVLRRAGVPDDTLADVPSTQAEAMDALRALLQTAPDEQRAMIISLGGVANWHNQTEWNALNLARRVVWLAFDGDVATNRHVWNQATQLWRHLVGKKADPRWLDLPVARTGPDGKPDRGLDDYLARIGPWSSLPRLLRSALPPAPPVHSAKQRPSRGDLRVNDTDCTVEILDLHLDVKGNQTAIWRTHAAIAGRIASIVEQRSASDEEVATGTRSNDPADGANVTLELTWIDPVDGLTRRHALVHGPDAILAESPGEWHKPRIGAVVPPAVKAHPDWPCDLRWLQAVKAHRREDIAGSVQWQHMGWVPTDTPGRPAFIVGRQVVDDTGFCDRVVPGIGERMLDGADLFGVSEPASDDELRDALRDVVATYTHAWRRDPRHGAVVLAAGLRPALPRVCVTPLNLTGQKGSAKSWTAAAAMYFWQAKPGTWSANRLPGSAGDTAASIEIALSRTPIWVVDDLAPGPDEQEEKREAAKLGKVIRAVFNRTGKRRATAEMQSAATHSPRALLMLTGENNRFSSSAESRYVLLEFTLGSLDDDWMERLDSLGKHTTKMSMITFAVIRMLAAGSYRVDVDGTPLDRSWPAVVGDLADEYRNFENAAEAVLGASNKRASGTAADLCLGLWALEQLCIHTGLPDLAGQVYAMRDQVISLVAQHLSGQSERTPARAALSAVRAALASGQAHIASTDTPGSSPVIGRSNSALIAARLGWLADGDGNLRAGGLRVGYLVRAGDDDPVVLLDPDNAFTVAARNNRQLVMFGSTAREAWKSAWAEGLTCPDGSPYTRAKDKDGRARLTVRAQVGGTQVSGVPFRLSTLLDDLP